MTADHDPNLIAARRRYLFTPFVSGLSPLECKPLNACSSLVQCGHSGSSSPRTGRAELQVLVHGRASVKNVGVVGVGHRQSRKGSWEAGQTTVSARVILSLFATVFLFVCITFILIHFFFLKFQVSFTCRVGDSLHIVQNSNFPEGIQETSSCLSFQRYPLRTDFMWYKITINIFCFVYGILLTLLSSYLKESIFCMGIQDKDGIPSAKKKLKVIELLSAT